MTIHQTEKIISSMMGFSMCSHSLYTLQRLNELRLLVGGHPGEHGAVENKLNTKTQVGRIT